MMESGKRVESVDMLRGIAIFMMILCSSIGTHSALPAWMFHCQVPPPDYVFRPEVRGLTWVDMVFPLFIFAMGAAIPYWLGSKLRKGESVPLVLLRIVKRFIVLAAFSLAIGHAGAISATDCGPVLAGALQLLVWLCTFAALWRTRSPWVNVCGWLAMAGIFLWLHFSHGLVFDFAQNDCIILLLAWAALMGGVIWLFTATRPVLRLCILAAIIVAKFFGFGFTQYLVIVIPATFAGELLGGDRTSRNPVAPFVALAAVVLQLWGLYTRNVLADLVVSAVLAAVFVLLVRKEKTPSSVIGLAGFMMLLCGVCFDFHDGGIAKDYCNLSYLFTTGGQSMLVLYFLNWMEGHGVVSRNLVMTGQNPMIAYTIAWSVVCPLLYIVGLMDAMNAWALDSPLMGVVRGLVVTLLTLASTCVFTRFRIFWKS